MFVLRDSLRAARPTRGAMLMTTRPNILLITSDQQRADCFGFENRHIKTPHIDLLATRDQDAVTVCLAQHGRRATLQSVRVMPILDYAQYWKCQRCPIVVDAS